MGGRHRMHEWTMRHWLIVAAALVVGVVAAGFTQDAARSAALPATSAPVGLLLAPQVSGTSTVDLVQALPGSEVRIEVDGKEVGSDVATGKTVGPLTLTPGSHEIRFIGDETTAASVDVVAGTDHDVVLHAPAQAGGAPLVSVYRTPTARIAAGKARVLLAHTAEVGPADIWVDGKPTFTDVSNGQFATADVPAGTHEVAIRAAGTTTKPVLGPIPVDLAAGTVTLAYAVGNPAKGGTTVVAHVERLRSAGGGAPVRIHTGSVGLASGIAVQGFGSGVGQGSGGRP